VEILQTALLLGVVSGLLYALSGAGLVLIYRTSGFISFAQGDIAAIGLFVAYFAYQAGAPYLVTALVTVVACAVAAVVIGGFVVMPLGRQGALTAGLATIGVGILVQGVENATVGNAPRPFPAVSDGVAVRLGAVQVQTSQVVQVVVTVVVFVVMGVAFRRLTSGVALRALNEDPEAAELLGVPGRRLRLLSWLFAGVLAALAGLFIVPIYTLTPTSVNAILLFGFCAVVVGGFDSVAGALVGGLVIGISANLVSAFLTPALVTSALYLTLLAVLLFRPHGLMGHAPMRRV
jgi:branched-chain amino acid transport system permease protein